MPQHGSVSELLDFTDARFYGQGLNCGLEDVRVLGAYLDNHGITGTTDLPPGVDPTLEAALSAYSRDRKADLDAICKLALDN